MQVTVLQENLNKGLTMVGRAVATRPTLPITSHVLLRTDQGRLKLVATNLEIALSAWVGAKVDGEGSIAVPARLLSEFVASLPNDRVELTVAPDSRQLEVRCARFQAFATSSSTVRQIPFALTTSARLSPRPRSRRRSANSATRCRRRAKARPARTESASYAGRRSAASS